MDSFFKACFKIVVGHEGGYTADSRDPGNWTGGVVGSGQLKGTKYGVSAKSYPTLDIKNLTVEKAEAIYYQNYWLPIGGNQLRELRGAGLALAVFDTAINSGVGRALKFLQNWKSYDSYLNGRLAWMKTLDIWPTYGRGWTNRINSLKDQCREVEAKFGRSSGNDLVGESRIIWVEGNVARITDIRRVFVNGEEIGLKEEDSVSVVGDKLYINLDTGGIK